MTGIYLKWIFRDIPMEPVLLKKLINNRQKKARWQFVRLAPHSNSKLKAVFRVRWVAL